MFYTSSELKKTVGIQVGKSVQISKLVKFYNFKGTIGDYCRIDDYTILKGNINIGKIVHISSFCILTATDAKSSISIGDFSSISAHCSIYAVSDNYISSSLHGPIVKKKYTDIHFVNVKIGKCCLIGLNSIILPKCKLKNFVSIAANSVINEKVDMATFLFKSSK